MGPLDELQRARLERLRGQIAFARRRGSDAPPLLLDAARRLEPVDAGMARETYLEALAAAMDQTDAITQATGIAPLKYASLMLAAWRGDRARALEFIDAARREATARGEGMGLGVIEWATALLHNGHGRYGEALAAAQRA